jgi:hypothetical protein
VELGTTMAGSTYFIPQQSSDGFLLPQMTILVSASISGVLLLAMGDPHDCPTGLSVPVERS